MRTLGAPGNSIDVLIADDDPTLRTGVRLLLEREGYSCAEAEQGEEAVELARRRKPRCVLLDLAMPALDGFAVARLLRADPQTHDLHLNCLTGLVDGRSRDQALQAGCENFLTKPLDAAVLLDVVRRQVQVEPPRPRTEELGGLTKEQAERLLDSLEVRGCSALEASVSDEGFIVRWSPPPEPGERGA
jgi:CheY-like chemotaxis protein